jgi:anaerobic selenocysteine-containing dehydrogenase
MRALAKKLGLTACFEKTDSEMMDHILKPAGITFDEFRRIGVIAGNRVYRSYEQDGFSTPSGKVELCSPYLAELGVEPLPSYREPPETLFSDPDLAQDFPLIMTSYKSAPFLHSGGRQLKSLRNAVPDPIVEIHPDTAAKFEIGDGDWIYIETKRGRIRQKAKLIDDLDPEVIAVSYGWWFPEKDYTEIFGWAESNVNVLTSDAPPFSKEMGSTTLRGMLCRISKA